MIREKSNEKEQKIILEIDRAINELVYEKTSLIKAYNYYHGKRDPEQFRHLEENYGIGTPTSVEFVPLVKKHIDVLIGEYLSTPVQSKVSCKDSETLSNINRDKQKAINDAVVGELKKTLQTAIQGQEMPSNKEVEARISQIIETLDRNFVSNYEIAAQNIVDWSMQSRHIDFGNKRKIILTDLLVSGTCYFKVCPSPGKTNANLKVLNPINTFIDRNPESPYLKDSGRAVVREYLTKHQILAKYGDILKKEDLDTLDTMTTYSQDGSTTTYLRSYDNVTGNTISDGILGGFEITPLLPYERNTSKYFRLYPVYEVEWLQTDKEDGEYITNRYEGVRIGASIYIPIGKTNNAIRSMDDPKHCALSVNGMFYSDRNGDPFSLILSTANLQDQYDLICFLRNNTISGSGAVGNWVDLAHLPKILGQDLAERIMKFQAYGKAGIKVYDSSQEGEVINTSFAGFDDTLKLNTIQAFDVAIQRIEEQVSTITGVFREKLGGVEQRDAVTNVQVGIRNSSFITKQYYQVLDLMTREILIDILNICKIVYKNGISGTLILGENLNKIFTALPEHYSFTDFDVHIIDSSEIQKELETIKQLSMDFTKNGLVDPEIILEMITSNGLTKMKSDVMKALNKKKNENNQLGQLDQQVKQLDSELKEVSGEAQKLQKEVQRLSAEKLQLEKERLAYEKELEWYKARSDNRFKEKTLEANMKRVELEGLQLLDENKRNDEIRDN